MDDPKKLICRFVDELWNERRLNVADAIFASDCVTHHSAYPNHTSPRGTEAIKENITNWVAIFPDLHFSIEHMLSEGDRVATLLRMQGTHKGMWQGVPPSGKTVQIRKFTIHRISGGKIVEDWGMMETLGFFQQLGLIPNTPKLWGNFLRQQIEV